MPPRALIATWRDSAALTPSVEVNHWTAENQVALLPNRLSRPYCHGTCAER